MQANRIICWNNNGLSQKQIAQKLGIHQSTISKMCKRNGIKLKSQYVHGSQCHNFKNYRTHDGRGCPTLRINGKPIREHRLIAAQILNRPPTSDELVHHKNGDVTDNRPENIQVVSRSEHKKLHPEIGKDTRFGARNDPRKV